MRVLVYEVSHCWKQSITWPFQLHFNVHWLCCWHRALVNTRMSVVHGNLLQLPLCSYITIISTVCRCCQQTSTSLNLKNRQFTAIKHWKRRFEDKNISITHMEFHIINSREIWTEFHINFSFFFLSCVFYYFRCLYKFVVEIPKLETFGIEAIHISETTNVETKMNHGSITDWNWT